MPMTTIERTGTTTTRAGPTAEPAWHQRKEAASDVALTFFLSAFCFVPRLKRFSCRHSSLPSRVSSSPANGPTSFRQACCLRTKRRPFMMHRITGCHAMLLESELTDLHERECTRSIRDFVLVQKTCSARSQLSQPRLLAGGKRHNVAELANKRVNTEVNCPVIPTLPWR